MDSYTKVTTKWYGSRIMDSIKSILFWLILFIASFFVLWTNEWTVDMSIVAKTSIETSSEAVDSSLNWELISVTWNIISDEKIGDSLYLKPGKYISVYRKVEMYSWNQTEHSESDTSVWGSETTTTTYEYNKEWSEYPDDSSSFEIIEWHNNPGKSLKSTANRVVKSNIWVYNIDTPSIRLPSMWDITLTEDIVNIDKSEEKTEIITSTGVTSSWTITTTTTVLKTTETIALVNWYLFEGKWKLANPIVWDIRISYLALKNWANVTVIWKQGNNWIESFSDKDWNELYRVFHGSREDAISTLRTEYLFKLWGFRALWFFLMWIGLSLLLWPISVVLDVLPILWSLSRGIVGIVTFIVALVLSIITIVISMIFHNIFALIITILVAWFFWYKYAIKKQSKLKISK